MSEEKQMTQDTKNAETAPGRRRFMKWVWSFFGLAALAEFGWLGGTFLNARNERDTPRKTESIVTAGPLEKFTPSTVTPIPQGQFHLARLEDGSLLALSRRCTHLGCSVPWNEEERRFVCPCHGSAFSLTGEVLTGPAPRPLDTFPVRIENGIVKVDISSPRKRDRFSPEQTARV
jgi:cytochrome b6-f complex iron-sulfur subunit